MKTFYGVVEYDGWFTYTDSGRVYRQWTFTEDVPGLDAESGDRLRDRGPEADTRFRVRPEGGDPTGVDEEKVDEFFDGCLPAWNPPNEAEIKIAQQLNSRGGDARLARELRRLAESLRTGSSSSSSGSSSTDNEGLQFGCLVVEREGRYSNTGGRLRVWRFLQDRPEIPAPDLGHHANLDGKPHAQEGDELWQEPDRLTPFKLKRGDGLQIGSPEHWQVEGAFGGEVPGWPLKPEEAGDQASDDGPDVQPDAYRYVSREQRCGDPFDGEHIKATDDRHGLYRFKRPVPPIGAEQGDVLVYAFKPSSRPKVMRGSARGLEPDEIEELRAYIRDEEGHALIEAIPIFFESLVGGEENLLGRETKWGWRKRGLLDFLHHAAKWGRRLSDFYHRLFLLKPVLEEVSDPIEAPHEEGALFKLISEAGGRMPEEG